MIAAHCNHGCLLLLASLGVAGAAEVVATLMAARHASEEIIPFNTSYATTLSSC